MRLIKRIKWPGWIVISLLLIVVTTSIYHLISIKTEATIADKDNNKVKVYQHDESKYPGLHLQTKTKETSKYTYSISTPTIDSEVVNKTIKKWIKQQKDRFFDEVENNYSILGSDRIAHLNIQLKTNKLGKDIYSLLFTSYHYTGGANGQQIIKPFVIDINNKKILQLEDVINLNEDTISILKELIKKEITNDRELNVFVMEDLLEEALENLENLKWAITKKSLIIYFDEYEIAAGAAGTVEVKIPLEELNSYLNDNILNESQKPKQKQAEKEEIEQNKTELDPNGKYVALTFDDGPSPKVTPRILDMLGEHDATATFFMLGNQVEYYPDIAKQVAKNGHEIASHSNSHPDMTKLSSGMIAKEMSDTSEKIEKATGIKPTLFRPPYGAYNNDVINNAKDYGYSIILWSVDSLDWKSHDASSVYSIIMQNVTNGSIILMHDIHDSTADALPQLLSSLKNEGYEFITVSELLDLENENGTGPYFGKPSN